jgi:hypothetical protein
MYIMRGRRTSKEGGRSSLSNAVSSNPVRYILFLDDGD